MSKKLLQERFTLRFLSSWLAEATQKFERWAWNRSESKGFEFARKNARDIAEMDGLNRSMWGR